MNAYLTLQSGIRPCGCIHPQALSIRISKSGIRYSHRFLFHLNIIDDDIVLPIGVHNDVINNDVINNDIEGEIRAKKRLFHLNDIGIKENVVPLCK